MALTPQESRVVMPGAPMIQVPVRPLVRWERPRLRRLEGPTGLQGLTGQPARAAPAVQLRVSPMARQVRQVQQDQQEQHAQTSRQGTGRRLRQAVCVTHVEWGTATPALPESVAAPA